MEEVNNWIKVPGEASLEISDACEIRTIARPMRVSGRDALTGQIRGNAKTSVASFVKRPWLQTTGYLVISWREGGKTHKRFVHRLVAKTFVPGFFEGATVDHRDGNKLNNSPENLEWVSLAENSHRQSASGRGAGRGTDHASGKLDDADWPQIKALRAQGVSLAKCGEKFGVSGSLIHKIETGKKRPWLSTL